MSNPSFKCACRFTFASLLVLLHTSCFVLSKRAIDAEASAMAYEIRTTLRPVTPTGAQQQLSPCQLEYMRNYGIDVPPSACRFGTFKSGKLNLAAQFYRPENSSKGTVIIVHGYLDHAGSTRHLINHLVAEGYNVAAYDQPGHGLSEGRRVTIKDFGIYETAFADFKDLVRSTSPGPYDVVAQSLGGTVVVDHLQKHQESDLRRIVLVAPLIQDGTSKHLKRFGHVISPVINYLPRVPEMASSDPSHTANLKADPLQSRFVSTRWSRSHSKWKRQDRIKEPTASALRPLVISAENETVIDEGVSNRWMRRSFPQGDFVTVKGGRHQLLNESLLIREYVLGLISDELARR